MRRESEINRYVIISIVVVAILIISLITFLISRSAKQSSERNFASEISSLEKESESASTQIGKSVNEASKDDDFEFAEFVNSTNTTTFSAPESKENNTTNTAKQSKNIVTNNTVETSSNTASDNKVENKTVETSNSEPKNIEFEAPIKGEIIREFAKDSLVFSNTLQEWITHTGIDIKADKTSVVKSAASGTVYAIKNDPRYGLTVIINHDNGYQTIYSNLLTAEFVVKGEKVEKGQSIGTVGNTASFEVSDEYHLHFELLKNNEYLDPTVYISFE